IKVVTVVGPAPGAVVVPVVGVARFALDWPAHRSVTLPSTLPRQGFLLAVGGTGLTGGITAGRLVAGTTDAELYDGVTCITEGVPAARNCFTGTWAAMGGAVSPGASAWFYYRLPAGDYAVGSDDHTFLFDRYFTFGLVQRVTVS
ncbi:MAG TPA: hypothetical protein VFL59_06995, partial [Candidatus Nanopelagicales bacterium]|nr:hypothetical protein [Candidatus Nanopelagicales bacterium]